MYFRPKYNRSDISIQAINFEKAYKGKVQAEKNYLVWHDTSIISIIISAMLLIFVSGFVVCIGIRKIIKQKRNMRRVTEEIVMDMLQD